MYIYGLFYAEGAARDALSKPMPTRNLVRALALRPLIKPLPIRICKHSGLDNGSEWEAATFCSAR